MTCDKTRSNKKATVFKFIITLTVTLLLLSFLLSSESISKVIYSSISDSAKIIIPTLFPTMVLARFMSDYGLFELYDRLLGKTISRVFKVSPNATSAIILGLLSSFPIGASTICELYKKGALTKEEAEGTLGAAHNTGPSFPVCIIGGSLTGSFTTGLAIYLIQIISSILTSRILHRRNRTKTVIKSLKIQNKSFPEAITSAVCDSTISCINIIGFVAMGKLTGSYIYQAAIGNETLAVILSSFIEFSSGAASAIRLGGAAGFVLCSLSISFGGIVALFQAGNYTAEAGLKLKSCVIHKTIQGFISSILAYLYYFFAFC